MKRYASSERWNLENPEKRKEVSRKANAKQKVRGRALILAAKDKPCADCDVRYPPYVMDFDHVRGVKLFSIGKSGNRGSEKRILDEISKCDVVCSNCHRERHHGTIYQ